MRRTKILATVGPATSSPAMLRTLVAAGVNAFRINFSHGTPDEHRIVLRRLHTAAARADGALAIVADLQGPKIRIGAIDGASTTLVEGRRFVLDRSTAAGGAERVFVAVPDLPHAARVGDPVLLGDGSIELVVVDVRAAEIETRVVHGGTLTAHAGLFLPRAHLRAQILGTKDRSDLALAIREGVDFVALSFVTDARDVRKARRRIRAIEGGKDVGLIAKIERAEALGKIDAILEASDSIMVARGDLGIEVPLERLALEQKRLVARANAAGKPVIVATQMLLSMLNSPRPTRAEATDVANAVLDGADAVMLSEESAVGRYPIESVLWLDRITRSIESAMASGEIRGPSPVETVRSLERSVASAAVELAHSAGAAAIITPTHSGRTARLVAAHRPKMPIVALSTQPSTRRQLALVWGVQAAPSPARMSLSELRALALRAAVRVAHAGPRDRIVLTAGYPVEGRPTNLVTVVELADGARPSRP
ncbi:MAG: pyruvate kinase [Thermoplasmata archaeon]|nr:pyruvate kinase [Thermoplasmata archaeon]MCI4353894.1 pyruvate kinase [Thermoplasmata archaeon]